MNLLELHCHVDEFIKTFMPKWNKHLVDQGKKKHLHGPRLSTNEIITILIHFHQSHTATLRHIISGSFKTGPHWPCFDRPIFFATVPELTNKGQLKNSLPQINYFIVGYLKLLVSIIGNRPYYDINWTALFL